MCTYVRMYVCFVYKKKMINEFSATNDEGGECEGEDLFTLSDKLSFFLFLFVYMYLWKSTYVCVYLFDDICTIKTQNTFLQHTHTHTHIYIYIYSFFPKAQEEIKITSALFVLFLIYISEPR